MKADSPAARLQAELQANHDLAERIRAPDFPRQAFEEFQAFQRGRLSQTYADLAAKPRYAAAVNFFLDELYGGLHFMERDQQVQRALPILVRMLPEYMQVSLCDAFRLQDLSLSLDIRLTEALLAVRQKEPGRELNGALYAELYPLVPRAQREEQIRLIFDLGLEIDRLVRHRLVLVLLRAMRGPARAAGFGALQTFLEDGFRSFTIMRGSREFVTTIRDRETAIMNRLYAGREDPFDWEAERRA